jgi:hypothetical protein
MIMSGSGGQRVSVAIGFLVGIVVLAPTGCGSSSGPQRYDLSGNVTWNGQPVAAGAITFEPLDMPDRLGDGFAHIRNGQFDTSVDGRGHFGGPHKVIITGSSGTLIDPRNPDSGTRPLFTPYETTVDLPKKRSTQDFTVE